MWEVRHIKQNNVCVFVLSEAARILEERYNGYYCPVGVAVDSSFSFEIFYEI